MNSEETTETPTPEAEADAQNGTEAAAGQEETPAKPLNRAERRAQAQGKTGITEGSLMGGLRGTNVQGAKGKQPGGAGKKSFQRKV